MSESDDNESGPVSKKIKINHYSSHDENDEKDEKDSSPKNENSSNEKKSLGLSDNDKESTDFSSVVVAHYNSTVQNQAAKRHLSRILQLRNFNNWIKGLLILDSVYHLMDQNVRNLTVLDMCCGKGGDLFKWSKLNVRYMVCTDISDESLEHFKTRYSSYLETCQRHRIHKPLQCEFIPADCTRVRIRGKFKDPSIRFDIVSCQFSFHYCFESLPQAECMLKNASECLKPGGLFIGTLPNAYEIVKNIKKSETNCFKNDVCSVEMCCSEPYPLFGAKYYFRLEEVVNCPEFLVYFPLFEKLALKYNLKLIHKASFPDFYENKVKTRNGQRLLRKIKALETFYHGGDKKYAGPKEQYLHAEIFCEQNNEKQVGTISRCEWEVISLYLTFMFKKVEAS